MAAGMIRDLAMLCTGALLGMGFMAWIGWVAFRPLIG
jgi:hypothetical protein